MSDLKTLLERADRAVSDVPQPPGGLDAIRRRRDRKRRNQRIMAGVVGIAVFVAAIWFVRDLATLNRTEKAVVPAGSGTTGPAETGPPVETGPFVPSPGPTVSAFLPRPRAVPATDYLFDLDTGQLTSLPKGVVGDDWNDDYAASPDGSKLAFVGRGENGTSQVFIANLDGTSVEQVTTEAEPEAPTWSPDGSKIAYIGQRGDEPPNIFLLDLAAGASTQVTSETEGVGAPLSFTPDGASIVYGADGGEIKIVQLSGSESAVLANLPDYDGELQLSPDGSRLAYSCFDGSDLGICVANADGSNGRRIAMGNGDAIGSHGWSPDGTRLVMSQFHQMKVYVMDVDTGALELVTYGTRPVWLDDHTLIVKPDCVPGPRTDVCNG